MLRWQPSRARPDEAPPPRHRSPLRSRTHSPTRSLTHSRTHSSPGRYLRIRQPAPPHPTHSPTHSHDLDLVPHYDHDITALHTAAEQGDVPTLLLLHSRGVDLNARNENGETASFLAALRGRTRVLELLARLGARLGVADRLGQTPLFVAASENLADTVRLLVRCGVRARARECVSVGARESVRARECVSVHTPNTYGCTPLYAAAMNGCLEVIHLLHELGADVDAPNNTGDAAVSH